MAKHAINSDAIGIAKRRRTPVKHNTRSGESGRAGARFVEDCFDLDGFDNTVLPLSSEGNWTRPTAGDLAPPLVLAHGGDTVARQRRHLTGFPL